MSFPKFHFFAAKVSPASIKMNRNWLNLSWGIGWIFSEGSANFFHWRGLSGLIDSGMLLRMIPKKSKNRGGKAFGCGLIYLKQCQLTRSTYLVGIRLQFYKKIISLGMFFNFGPTKQKNSKKKFFQYFQPKNGSGLEKLVKILTFGIKINLIGSVIFETSKKRIRYVGRFSLSIQSLRDFSRSLCWKRFKIPETSTAAF